MAWVSDARASVSRKPHVISYVCNHVLDLCDNCLAHVTLGVVLKAIRHQFKRESCFFEHSFLVGQPGALARLDR